MTCAFWLPWMSLVMPPSERLRSLLPTTPKATQMACAAFSSFLLPLGAFLPPWTRA